MSKQYRDHSLLYSATCCQQLHKVSCKVKKMLQLVGREKTRKEILGRKGKLEQERRKNRLGSGLDIML